MAPRYFPAMLACVALFGCDLAPDFQRPAMPVPAGFNADSAPTPASERMSTAAWQDFFDDDRLRKLIALALENNRDLRAAAINMAEARAQYDAQEAQIAPTVAVTGNAYYEKVPPGFSGSGAGAAAPGGNGRFDIYAVNAGISSWEIDLFGHLRNLSKAAQEQYFASEAARDAARTSLIADLATTYLTMAADQDQVGVAQNMLRAFGDTLDLTRQRLRLGISSELDVRQAQTSYDQARSDLANTRTLVVQDQNRLDLLAGTVVPRELLPTGLNAHGATIDHLPPGLSSKILLRRPDIVEAEHQLRAADADIGAARAAFFPTISLTAMAGTLSLGLSDLFGGNSGAWTVAPTASFTIFDYGRSFANLRYVKANRDAALVKYEKVIQTGFREVADALARRDSITAQLEAQISLRGAAAGAYHLSEARYRIGIEPFLNTLDSQRSLYTAEKSLIATRLTRETNLVELYRSLGGGLR